MKRILTLLLCLCLTLGLLLCTVSCDEVPEDPTLTYEDILTRYEALLTEAADGAELSAPTYTDESEREIAVYDAIFDTVQACEDPAQMGYSTKDINGDGQSELTLISRDCKIYAVFTLTSGKPMLVANLQGEGAIDENGTFYLYTEDAEADTDRAEVKSLKGGTLIGIEFGRVGEEYYKIEAGVRSVIDEETVAELSKKHFPLTFRTDEIVKKACFRFIPILNAPDTSELPTTDFSSFEAILKTFEAVTPVLESYTDEKWLSGELDQLFAFGSDTDYVLFYRLLRALMPYAPASGTEGLGYALHDLNGDEVDELVLMTERYDILAIFSLQKEAPTLLLSADANRTLMLDAAGRIYLEYYSDDMLTTEAAIYTVDASGKLRTDMHVGMISGSDAWESNSYYKIENSLKLKVEYEEIKDLIKRFKVTEATQSASEYTKLNAALSYTPLQAVEITDRIVGVVYSNADKIDSLTVTVTALDEASLTFELAREGEIAPIATLTATKAENGYAFETDTLKGTLEIGCSSLWLTVTECEDAELPLQAFLLYQEIMPKQ